MILKNKVLFLRIETSYYYSVEYTTIDIEYPNGKRKKYSHSDFDFYASTNELEHKTENLIITLSDLKKSFTYDIDEYTGEITKKDYICSIELG